MPKKSSVLEPGELLEEPMSLEGWNRLGIGDIVRGRLGDYHVCNVRADSDGVNALTLEPCIMGAPALHFAKGYEGFRLLTPAGRQDAIRKVRSSRKSATPEAVHARAQTIEDAVSSADAKLLFLALDKLFPSPTNPRKRFDEAKLAELAESIKSHGILQPLVVRAVNDRYEVCAGERRYRAAKLADLDELPCVLRELSDADVLEIQVIENNQREDVHPLEEADGFKAILDSGRFGEGRKAAEQLAEKLGKSVSYVYQRLKLLALNQGAREAFLADKFTAHHAVILARLTNDGQKQVLKFLVERDFSVRDLQWHIAREILVKLSTATFDLEDESLGRPPCTKCPKRASVDADLMGADVDPEDDQCLDKKCFQAKHDAMVAKRIAELESSGETVLKVSQRHSGQQIVRNNIEVIPSDKWRPAKPGDKNAVKALVTDEHPYSWNACKPGSIIEVVPVKGATPEEKVEAQRRKESLDERRQKVMIAYKKDLAGRCLACWPITIDITALRGIALTLWEQCYSKAAAAKLMGWVERDDRTVPQGLEQKITELDEAGIAKLTLAIRIGRDVQVDSSYYVMDKPTTLEATARLLGIDVEAAKAEVEAMFPKPEKPKKSTVTAGAPGAS